MRIFYIIILILGSFIFFFNIVFAESLRNNLYGRIILLPERNGEAWYLSPKDNGLHFLGRPKDAFEIMKSQGLGITNKDFYGMSDSDKVKYGGQIFLLVEDKGQAFYINPETSEAVFLNRPKDAFWVMKNLAIGVSNDDFEKLKTALKEKPQETILTDIFVLDVPFSSQAPLAEWHDDRFQDGCEEASIMMAMYYVQGKSKITTTEARASIIALSKFQSDNGETYHDSSAFDTMNLLKEYYDYDNVIYREDIDIYDIKDELNNKRVVVIPVNGQKLKNPHFTYPGPINHMLIVIGYDDEKKEFITHDPGTRMGEGYRYSYDVLDNALRDYPTGYHEEIKEIKKVFVSVGR